MSGVEFEWERFELKSFWKDTTTGGNISLAMNLNSKANSRRRTVVVIEKKLESEEGINGVTDWAANGNDLIHTIRGESVLERPKDMSHYKKGSVTSATISPRRKKPVPKPEKPKWQTVLSILTKNCLLLAAALWLGQMIWKWADKVQYPTNNTYLTLEYEGRVSGVETSLKSMAKMFQVQSEVLDKKIGSEVGTVRREVMKQIEEKGALLGKELKSLDAKADSLEKSLSELKDMGFISKEEFEKFWNDLKNSGRLDGSVQDVNLDKIRVFARNIVEKEIEKHASDGLGRVDYALATGGAKVTEHSQPYTFGKPDSWSAALKRRRRVHVNAHKMLEPSFGEPGHCFALEGSSGYIQIRLRTAIIPEAVTLEHVSKTVAYDRSSAPKEGMVLGWFGEPIIDPSNPPTLYLIAKISYDLEKSNAQTFNVEPGITSPINNVRLEIDSNHGSSSLTCIYRFRVHGYEPSSPAIGATQA